MKLEKDRLWCESTIKHKKVIVTILLLLLTFKQKWYKLATFANIKGIKD